MKKFAWLSAATTALTFPLIALGAIVRLKGAGLSCPDWPLCYGEVTPLGDVISPAPEGVGIALEVGHRYVAGTVGLLVLALLVFAWVSFKDQKSIRIWASIAMALLIPQAVLGGLTVLMRLAPITVSMHLLFGNLFFASMVMLTVRAFSVGSKTTHAWKGRSAFGLATKITVPLLLLQIFLGGFVSSSGASLVCPSFPMCDGYFLLGLEPNHLIWLQMTHRAVGFVTAFAIIAFNVTALRSSWVSRRVKVATGLMVAIVIVQILVGWYNVANYIPVPTSALHTALAATLVGLSTLVLATVSARVSVRVSAPAKAPTPVLAQPLFARVRDYVRLGKPGIINLLLILTFCTMLVAEGGMPEFALIFWTMLGMTLISASANACNMVYDRDIDAIMKRTQKRPLPDGRVSVTGALIFAVVTGVIALLILGIAVNVTTMLVAAAGHLFYVFVYTMWLKRSTPHNIVIGGAAGAVPPLIGWAAVAGSLDLSAWVMFLVVFLWTPPHFWALALYKCGDYEAANIPMLPVVRGVKTTKIQILYYTVLLIPTTIALGFMGSLGLGYMVMATILGAIFCYMAIRVALSTGDYWPRRTFFYSILYLGLLFIAMSIDSTLLSDWGRVDVEPITLQEQTDAPLSLRVSPP